MPLVPDTDFPPDDRSQSWQNRAPLRITVHPYPPSNGSSDDSDGIDDWIVPGKSADDGYPDDWIVPPKARDDASFPDDWIVPSPSTTAHAGPLAPNPQSNFATSGISNSLTAPSVISSAPPSNPLADYFSLLPANLVGMMAWRAPTFPNANPFSPDNLPASAWPTRPPIFLNSPGQYPSMGNLPASAPPVDASRGLLALLGDLQFSNPAALPSVLRAGLVSGFGDRSAPQSLLQKLSDLNSSAPPIPSAVSADDSGIEASTASPASLGEPPAVLQAQAGRVPSDASSNQIFDVHPSTARPEDVVGIDQTGGPSENESSSEPLGEHLDSTDPIDETPDPNTGFTLSQVRALGNFYLKIASSFADFLRSGAEVYSHAPADIADMAHDAFTDFPEFLRRAEPGLVGLGMAVPMTRATGNVWRLLDTTRGRVVELLYGRNLPFNFHVIDRFENEVVTSIKSIDLNARSYQNASSLGSTLRGYINKVAEFTEGKMRGTIIKPDDFTGRALDVIVPHSGSAVQKSAIEQAVKYGVQRAVTVNIIVHR